MMLRYACGAVTLTLLLGTVAMAPHATAQNQPALPPMPGVLLLVANRHLALRDMTTGEVRPLPDGATSSINIHPNGQWAVYNEGVDFRVMDLVTGLVLQIGRDTASWHPTEGWLTINGYRNGLSRMDLPATLDFQPVPSVTVTEHQSATGARVTTIGRVYPTPAVPFAASAYLAIERVSDFAWHHDGQQIVIGRTQKRPNAPGSDQILYQLDLADCRRADGTLDAQACEAALVPLTEGVYATAKRPAYSPDGRWLAFDASRLPGTEDNYFAWRIVVLDLHTGAMREVTTPVRYNQSADGSRYDIIDDLEPVWGPDGRTLVFSRSASTPDRRVGLVLHNLDTSEEVALPPVDGHLPGIAGDWWWPGKYAPIPTS